MAESTDVEITELSPGGACEKTTQKHNKLLERRIEARQTMLSPTLSEPTIPTARPEEVRQSGKRKLPLTFTRSLSIASERTGHVKNYICKKTAIFFGVDEDSKSDSLRRWSERRRRFASRKFGQFKEEKQIELPLKLPKEDNSVIADSFAADVGVESNLTLFEHVEGACASNFDKHLNDELEVFCDGEFEPIDSHKESVAAITWVGIVYLATKVKNKWVGNRTRNGEDKEHKKAHSIHSLPVERRPDVDIELHKRSATLPAKTTFVEDKRHHSVHRSVKFDDDKRSRFNPVGVLNDTSHEVCELEEFNEYQGKNNPQLDDLAGSTEEHFRNEEVGQQSGISEPVHQLPESFETKERRRAFKAKHKKPYAGMGNKLLQFFHDSVKGSSQSIKVSKNVLKRDHQEDFRPYFTCWAISVQAVVTVLAVWLYGIAPKGFGNVSNSTEFVMMYTMSPMQIEKFQQDNFWIGPRAADLIRLGANFAPCMRRDRRVMAHIESAKSREKATRCCINYFYQCIQTSRQDCSFDWQHWGEDELRTSGPVCGLDPEYCADPISLIPHIWPDDITKWPVCKKKIEIEVRTSTAAHMTCENVGRPCCVNVLGECIITTEHHCDFVKGVYHKDSLLCSQVSCMNSVCAMIPFHTSGCPYQIYRLITSLFLHAGILHLLLSLVVQWSIMREVEKVIGPLRIGIIYFGTGMFGNLASAIFMPYTPEVGPSGSLFGLLAAGVVELIHFSWCKLKRPWVALIKQLLFFCILFLLGLLPWVDNYAHLFGFLFGFVLYYAFVPYVCFANSLGKRISLHLGALFFALLSFLGLLLLFYKYPFEHDWFKYFTCFPLHKDFCDYQNVQINYKRNI